MVEENEEAASSLGSASVSLAVARILRGTSLGRLTAKACGGRVGSYWLFVIGGERKVLNREWTRMNAKGGGSRGGVEEELEGSMG